jgi:NAD(P)H-hydrate epimerase
LTTGRPLVVDADALNLLAKDPHPIPKAVITPHPGEAARLLGLSSSAVNRDRFQVVERLRQSFAPVAVLKGAGTLIDSEEKSSPGLCSAGNPGMATAGMGDVLTGVIGGLLAQGMGLVEAAEFGVVLHAAAADCAALKGERGLLALDVADKLQEMLQTCPY